MELIEAGQIVNTHGVRGEVRVIPWSDTPDFLCAFDTVYIDEKPYEIAAARVHKGSVLLALEGVSDVMRAALLRNKTVCVDKKRVKLPPGHYFISDLIGLEVIDSLSGESIGKISDVLTPPANDVYVVRGEAEYMIPAVKEFIIGIDQKAGEVRVRLIPGMRIE